MTDITPPVDQSQRLLDFVFARLDESTRLANAASGSSWEVVHSADDEDYTLVNARTGDYAGTVAEVDTPRAHADATHIVRHDPATSLRELAAFRRTVAFAREQAERHQADLEQLNVGALVRAIADVYVDHPDYPPAYAPDDTDGDTW